MFDDHAKKARDVIDVPWDEVRAARVHKKALEAFERAKEEELAAEGERELADERADEPTDGSEAAPEDETIPMVGSRRGWLVLALAAAAAIALWIVRPGGDPGEGAVAMTWQAASTLQYTDGSRSLLAERAEVQVVDDRDDHVEVEQRAGLVRYEIAKRPERRFVVDARDVTVTVLGTVFEVDVAGDEVTVSVQRGRVRVEHGATQVELTRGQRIALTAPKATAARHDGRSEAAADETDDVEEAGSNPEDAAEDDDAATSDTEPAGSGGGQAGPSAAELMRAADTARGAGRLDEAARRLHQLVATHPRDARVTLAMFTLGRVERERGRHDAAARAFESCGDALRGDAIAEAASSWLAAGDGARASAAARRYLDAHPSGVHAEQMKKVAGGP